MSVKIISILLMAELNVIYLPSAKCLSCDPQPLILTPLIQSGNIQSAQNQSMIYLAGRMSYTGYFRTNDDCGNNLFFWFFPAVTSWEKAPLIVWLNGGPGASSMFGLFNEIGPWNRVKSGFVINPYTWTTDYNVIFFDQPVGTGFSFSEKGCIADSLVPVMKDMYSAISQFLTMFPQLQNNKVFLAGESYAGHYLPRLAVEIDQRNSIEKLKINLAGIFVGNAYVDILCIDISTLLYEMGIVDTQGRDTIEMIYQHVVKAVGDKNYTKATMMAENYYNGVTLPSVLNIVYSEPPNKDYRLFIRNLKFRKLIHVGYTPFTTFNYTVYAKLYEDQGKSQSGAVEYLLKSGKYAVGFYTGQLDTLCPVSSVSCVLRGLQWDGAGNYRNSPKSPWYVSGKLAGWVKAFGNLSEVVVRNSGHLVPTDQGEIALAMIKAVVSGDLGLKGLQGTSS